jgi:GntR family transcriptional regulator / MocR family aminotransferase
MAHKLTLNLDVFSPLPLYLQIASQVKNAIESERLSAGEKLPSIRDFAKQLQLSQSTIREAIDKLVEWNLVVARPGSGNYVARQTNIEPQQTAFDRTTKEVSSPDNFDASESTFFLQTFIGALQDLDPQVHWSKEARQQNACFNEHPFHPWWNKDLKYDYRSWESSFEFMQGARWEKIVSRWSSKLSSMSEGYSSAAGMPELRSIVADWLNRTRNLNCSADDLLITTGAQQCRALIAQITVDETSKVVVEEPASITDILAYESRGASLIHIPQDRHGIQVERLTGVKADLAHIISTANFPTGYCLARNRRDKLLDWAEANQTLIVEDAYGAGFYYDAAEPTLYELAQQRNLSDFVIYHGSFSQAFMPALRIGYALVPAWLKHGYFRTKWLDDRHPSTITQTLLLELFADGFFDDHFLKLTAAATQRRKALLRELLTWSPDLVQYDEIKSGFHQAIWFKPESQIDDLLVFERAMREDIGFIPLSPYFLTEEKRSGLLLNFLGLPEKQITEGCRKLWSVILSCSNSLST